jgi:hypothetical protein
MLPQNQIRLERARRFHRLKIAIISRGVTPIAFNAVATFSTTAYQATATVSFRFLRLGIGAR